MNPPPSPSPLSIPLWLTGVHVLTTWWRCKSTNKTIWDRKVPVWFRCIRLLDIHQGPCLLPLFSLIHLFSLRTDDRLEVKELIWRVQIQWFYSIPGFLPPSSPFFRILALLLSLLFPHPAYRRFNPHDERQAIARAYRIGQKKTVLVLKLVCRSTIEESVMKVQQSKLALEHVAIKKIGDVDPAYLSSLLLFDFFFFFSRVGLWMSFSSTERKSYSNMTMTMMTMITNPPPSIMMMKR